MSANDFRSRNRLRPDLADPRDVSFQIVRDLVGTFPLNQPIYERPAHDRRHLGRDTFQIGIGAGGEQVYFFHGHSTPERTFQKRILGTFMGSAASGFSQHLFVVILKSPPCPLAISFLNVFLPPLLTGFLFLLLGLSQNRSVGLVDQPGLEGCQLLG